MITDSPKTEHMLRENRHLPPAWASDMIAMFIVVSSSVFPGRPMRFEHPSPLALMIGVSLFAALLLPLRRRWPIGVFAACLVLYSTTTILDFPVLGAGIAVTVASFALANQRSRRVTFIATAIACILVTFLSVTAAKFSYFDPRIFQIAAAIAVAAALGDSARSRHDYFQAATDRAERAEMTREVEAQRRVAEERLRIAQDLHDTVAHSMSVINLNAGVASNAIDTNPEKTRAALGTIRNAAQGVLGEISDLLRYLRSDDGWIETLSPQQPDLTNLDQLLENLTTSGLNISSEVSTTLAEIPKMASQVAYRVVQEGLTNAHKHGSENRAALHLETVGSALIILITNPILTTPGRQPNNVGTGFGLTGLYERVASVRGLIESRISSSEYILNAEIPLTRSDIR